VPTQATEGVADLRDADYEQNLYTLGGQWEFYYDKLLTPADFSDAYSIEAEYSTALGDGTIRSFASGTVVEGEYATDNGSSKIHSSAADSDAEKVYLTVPSDWSLNGYPLYGCATYRLRILTNERQLTLFVPEIPDASRIYIDGEVVFTAGNVSDSPEGYTSSVRNAFVTFDTRDGEAELLIQVANYNWEESGLRYDLLVGRPSVMLKDSIMRRMVLAAFIGAVIMMGLYHGALYVSSRREKIYAVFALICIFLGIRFFLETNGFAQLLMPNGLDSTLTLIYLFLMPIGTGLSVWFTYLAFDIKKHGGVHGMILKLFYGGDIFLCVVIILFRQSLYLLALLLLLPLLVVLVTAVRKGNVKDKPYMRLYLFAIVIFMIWGIMTKIIWGDRLYMPGIASNVFLMLSQCVLLALDYGRNRRQAEELAAANHFLDNLSRMKTEYLANLTHEMKTPLTVVSLHIQRALRNLPKGDDKRSRTVRESLTAAKSETMKVASMAQMALDNAFLEEGHKSMEVLDILDVGELLRKSQQAFQPVARKGNNELKLHLPPSLPHVLGDEVLLSRGIANLLNNACTATQNGQITITAKADHDYVTITIFDDGTPIPDEILGREFMRGVSGSGSTGLGLTITDEIMKAHGGSVSLQNVEGGVAAELILPIVHG
jgi:signal transduction histidine kinase